MNYKDIIFLTSDALYGDNLFIASRNKTANPGFLQDLSCRRVMCFS